jgi:hypothetical protein
LVPESAEAAVRISQDQGELDQGAESRGRRPDPGAGRGWPRSRTVKAGRGRSDQRGSRQQGPDRGNTRLDRGRIRDNSKICRSGTRKKRKRWSNRRPAKNSNSGGRSVHGVAACEANLEL